VKLAGANTGKTAGATATTLVPSPTASLSSLVGLPPLASNAVTLVRLGWAPEVNKTELAMNVVCAADVAAAMAPLLPLRRRAPACAEACATKMVL
jgi:hypothetical protein